MKNWDAFSRFVHYSQLLLVLLFVLLQYPQETNKIDIIIEVLCQAWT